MAEPVPQKVFRTFNFTNFSATQPTTPLPGNQVDNEYDAADNTINDVIDFVRQAIDDDGMVREGAIGDSAIGPPGPFGPPGPPGPTGPQGVVGAHGDQGAQGIQGPSGAAGASYNPNAIGPLSDRALYNTQPKNFSFLDSVAGILYFKLSATSGDWSAGIAFGRGPTGPQGPQGVQGFQGARGPQGLQGLQGVPGTDGAPGATGAPGPQGIPGNTGDTGPQGLTGAQGPVGPMGPVGMEGHSGPTGAPGPYADIKILVAKTVPADADIHRLQSAADGFADMKITYLNDWAAYFKLKADALYLKIASNLAVVADFWAATVGSKLLAADVVWAAAVPQGTATGGTIAVNLGAGVNFKYSLASNATLDVVTNAKQGQSGVIEIFHNGGARTIALNATYWVTPGSAGLSLSTVANVRDLLGYYVLSTGKVVVFVISLGMP